MVKKNLNILIINSFLLTIFVYKNISRCSRINRINAYQNINSIIFVVIFRHDRWPSDPCHSDDDENKKKLKKYVRYKLYRCAVEILK